MRFINNSQKIRRAIRVVRKIRQQRIRCLTGSFAREMSRIVFNTRTISDLANHRQVICRTALETLRFEQLSLRVEFSEPDIKFCFDCFERLCALGPTSK